MKRTSEQKIMETITRCSRSRTVLRGSNYNNLINHEWNYYTTLHYYTTTQWKELALWTH